MALKNKKPRYGLTWVWFPRAVTCQHVLEICNIGIVEKQMKTFAIAALAGRTKTLIFYFGDVSHGVG